MVDPGKPLYYRLGGYDVIAALVDDLLHRVAADPQIGVYWKSRCNDSIKRERQLVVDFLCAATGGSANYLGRNMKISHEGLGISESDWNVFLQHAAASLEHVGVADEEKKEFLACASSLRGDIVETAHAPGTELLKHPMQEQRVRIGGPALFNAAEQDESGTYEDTVIAALQEIKTETKFLWQQLTNHIDDDSPFSAKIRGRTLKAIQPHLATLRATGVQYELKYLQFDSKSGDDIYDIVITRTTPALWEAVKTLEFERRSKEASSGSV